ncbi:MAG: S1/P1 Nuclease [Ancylobacter novellus]|uniref:S1/P1 Nuclease n=1 Tax=Ancylobacter novellus TaxID=921 RepID=A0A2W5KQF6_ANCNO|nr:MAG: S1/P1 Nuclease [Ancylobacter novellus]
MRILAVVVTALLAAHPLPAMAWGKTGHRAASAIAERYLSPQAIAGVATILGRETLAEASTWPDFMRSDPGEFWRSTASPWHYVTIAPGKAYADVGAPAEGDAVTALARFSATVRDPAAPLPERQLALRFIVHIVEDLHQPFHVGNGSDRGGNDVDQFFGRDTTLHALWDEALIDEEKLSFTEWADKLSRRIEPDQLRKWSDPDPMTWVAESARIRDGLYPVGQNLRFEYGFQHLATLELRLAQAGVRTAAYLNQLFAAERTTTR